VEALTVMGERRRVSKSAGRAHPFRWIMLPVVDFETDVRICLGGQCKTGHAGSLQNRPYEMARDVILFIPLSPDQASLFWFSNSAAHI
jgi:hypothetical protein